MLRPNCWARLSCSPWGTEQRPLNWLRLGHRHGVEASQAKTCPPSFCTDSKFVVCSCLLWPGPGGGSLIGLFPRELAIGRARGLGPQEPGCLDCGWWG